MFGKKSALTVYKGIDLGVRIKRRPACNLLDAAFSASTSLATTAPAPLPYANGQIGPGTMLHRFPNKQALMLATLEMFWFDRCRLSVETRAR